MPLAGGMETVYDGGVLLFYGGTGRTEVTMVMVAKRKKGHDLIVVGGGPAGLSAALFGARLGLAVLLLEKGLVGGHPAVMARIDDFPGVAEADGWDLTRTMERQVRTAGVILAEDEEVESICPDSGRFLIRTGLGREVRGRAVILATGGEPEPLQAPGAERLARKGLHSCVQCAGPAYKGRRAAVCGNRNPALAAAAHLLTLTDTVFFITRAKEMHGDAALLAPLLQHPGLVLLPETRIRALKGGLRLEHLVLEEASGQVKTLEVDALFNYQRMVPRTGMVDAAKDSRGFLKQDGHGAASMAGLFGAGFVVDPEARLVTAVADGCRVAQAVARYLTAGQSE